MSESLTARVLIVEDQPAVAEAIEVLLDVHDIGSAIARTPEAAVELVRAGGFAAVIQDMNFSPGATSGAEGIELFRRIRAVDPAMPILLMTAWTSLETAVELVREGAHDYLAKPWSDEKLLRTLRALLDARAPLAAPNDVDRRGGIFESERMKRLVELAAQVARSDVPVLITGPNGAGKEKIAEILQAASSRARGPFVKVNVGALPDELLEAELFGAEPGAFTGATKLRIGRFEAANGGTLFLDEIGTLSLAGQKKLLRVLEQSEFQRLGSSETRRVDVRVIAATNADLRAEVAAGRFREDLFFRLDVIELAVPPLRDRREDILPLARAFLRAHGGGELTTAAERALVDYGWPGNVRELQNRVRRALIVKSGPRVDVADLDLDGPREVRDATSGERAELEIVLRKHAGSVSRAASELGLSRQALYRKMDRLGIVLERKPREE